MARSVVRSSFYKDGITNRKECPYDKILLGHVAVCRNQKDAIKLQQLLEYKHGYISEVLEAPC